jgi:hypothetical protein
LVDRALEGPAVTVSAMSAAHDYTTRLVLAAELCSSDVLVGECGGLSAVFSVKDSLVMPGCVAVETEHGNLYLDAELEVDVHES